MSDERKSSIEFYLLRIWKHPLGFTFRLCEVYNFDTGKDWALFTVNWCKKAGLYIGFSQ